jgi:adenylyltransferase/sulfurtransferase
VYPDPPAGAQPTCETAGVLNAVIGVVASWQVADALKLLSGNASLVRGRITTVDVWSGEIRQIAAPERDPECAACGLRQFPFLEEAEYPPVALCGRNAVQIRGGLRQVDLAELERRLEPLGQVRANEYALRFRADGGYELTVFTDGRAIIKGTSDPGLARSIYARYIG